MKRQQDSFEKKVPRWFKAFNIFALIVVLTAAIYVISTDIGDYADHRSGAGDIWWVDAPEVNESYYSIIDKSK